MSDINPYMDSLLVCANHKYFCKFCKKEANNIVNIDKDPLKPVTIKWDCLNAECSDATPTCELLPENLPDWVYPVKNVQDIKRAMIPRNVWFKCRVDECLEEIRKLNADSDIIEYKKEVSDLANELIYAVNEWNKFYPDN